MMIYNIAMIFILIIVIFSLNVSSEELIIDIFGKEEVKIYLYAYSSFDGVNAFS